MLSCVYASCTLCLSSLHHDDHACVLLCLLLSTYSAASSSSLRNFLTSKFLSEEFIKISYSPPSSRYNALLPGGPCRGQEGGRHGAQLSRPICNPILKELEGPTKDR